VGLHHKQYYVANKSYSEEEYFRILSQYQPFTEKTFSLMRQQQDVLSKGSSFSYLHGYLNENVTGDYLKECKNDVYCFDAYQLEDCAYIFNSPGGVHTSYDSCFIANSECLLECLSGVGEVNQISTLYCWSSGDIFYSDHCFYCHDLFGCIGLRHADHCILNKKYAPDEYEIMHKKIIQHMKETGEWGEFFPIKNSLFAYNETVAQEYFPIDISTPGVKKNDDLYSTQGLHFQFRWRDADTKNFQPATIVDLSDEIKSVDEKICSEILACERCKKNYKIQLAELKFYQKMGLPIPRNCPDCRHADRMQLRNPRHLWERKCSDCGAKISTTFAPDRPEKILCEKCYFKIVR